MLTKDARSNKSQIALSFQRKQGKCSRQRSNKRPREESEDSQPAVIVSQASTATITVETVNTNSKLLLQSSI